METNYIDLDLKYFEPIRKGEITLLIFDKKVIDEKECSVVTANKGSESISVRIKNTCVKSFSEITDEEAVKAGFLNKEFLKDELIRRFDMDTLDVIINSIDSYLFFLVEISNKRLDFCMSEIKRDTDLFKNSTIKHTMDFFVDDKEENPYRVWRYDDESL